MLTQTVWWGLAEFLAFAERLRAHARLCRQIAAATWSEEIAAKLGALADECTRAAEEAESEARAWAQQTDCRHTLV